MLTNPYTAYRIHQFRHRELVAAAERFRLANIEEDGPSQPPRDRLSRARRLAAFIGAMLRGGGGRKLLPRLDDEPAKTMP